MQFKKIFLYERNQIHSTVIMKLQYFYKIINGFYHSYDSFGLYIREIHDNM